MPDTVLHRIISESPELAKSTRGRYLRDVNAWIAFAGTNPKAWTRYRAQEFYGGMLERGMRPQSANRVMASLRYASSWWAKKENDPNLDFAVVQKAGPSGKQRRHALEPEEAQALLATCAGDHPMDLRDRALIVVGLETGMRRMSLASMMLEGIKPCRDGYPVVTVPIKGRGTDLFVVPLSDTAIEALAPWRAWLRTQKISSGPVFRSLMRKTVTTGHRRGFNTHIVGESLTTGAIYQIVTRRARQAGLTHVHPHIFRHTFITWRMQDNFEPYEVASITGHKIASIPGLGGLGSYIDGARIANKTRQSTPPWLAKLIKTNRGG
jgi:integrase